MLPLAGQTRGPAASLPGLSSNAAGRRGAAPRSFTAEMPRLVSFVFQEEFLDSLGEIDLRLMSADGSTATPAAPTPKAPQRVRARAPGSMVGCVAIPMARLTWRARGRRRTWSHLSCPQQPSLGKRRSLMRTNTLEKYGSQTVHDVFRQFSGINSALTTGDDILPEVGAGTAPWRGPDAPAGSRRRCDGWRLSCPAQGLTIGSYLATANIDYVPPALGIPPARLPVSPARAASAECAARCRRRRLPAAVPPLAPPAELQRRRGGTVPQWAQGGPRPGAGRGPHPPESLDGPRGRAAAQPRSLGACCGRAAARVAEVAAGAVSPACGPAAHAGASAEQACGPGERQRPRAHRRGSPGQGNGACAQEPRECRQEPHDEAGVHREPGATGRRPQGPGECHAHDCQACGAPLRRVLKGLRNMLRGRALQNALLRKQIAESTLVTSTPPAAPPAVETTKVAQPGPGNLRRTRRVAEQGLAGSP